MKAKHWIYEKLLKPRAEGVDNQRREFILNILLVSMIALSGLALISATSSYLQQTEEYNGGSFPIVIGATILFTGSLIASRRGYYGYTAGLFIGLLFILSSYCIAIWGILLPQAILMYALVIVIAGVLISSRASFFMTGAVIITLVMIKSYEDTGAIEFNRDWMSNSGGYNDIVVYGSTFLAIATVSWLSNREIERSLTRALISERNLLAERNSLEIKVRKRTAELEKSQMEKMLELHRFAEFGRLSSTLLHDLANPLTSLSLELEQIRGKKTSVYVERAQEGLAYMEQYVTAARRQLRDQSELKDFNLAHEIKLVVSFLESKASNCRVKIVLHLDENISIHGDAIRFNQIIANLVANAIDAYDHVTSKHRKVVTILLEHTGGSATLSVHDEGTGISSENTQRVFEPFYTTKASQRGTGIGLSITRQAVEEDFEGTIMVESSPKKGTIFTVCIPLT